MNYQIACDLLKIDHSIIMDENIVKKKYKIQALIYHPDKNKDPNACEQFQQIYDAYEFLLHYLNNNYLKQVHENLSYSELLTSFLKTNNHYNQIFNIIIHKITQLCEDKVLIMLNKINKDLLFKIYELLVLHKDVFFVSDTLLIEIYNIINEKIKNDKCIILNPLLDDLFDHNLYKLSIDNNIFLVPLWHDELTYDNSGADLYVKCSPVLPENVYIDENNNIVVDLKYNITDIWNKEKITIELGNKIFDLNTEELQFKNKQQYIFKKKGISIINKNISDISNLSDIILNIHIFST
jgi:hypothetical protein